MMRSQHLDQVNFALVKPIALFLGKVLLLLFLAGSMLGLLHQYDLFLAALLGAALILWLGYVHQRLPRHDQFFAFLLGVSLTAVAGIAAEKWGTKNGYWVYHDLSNGRDLAYWLPFAWAWAYIVMYATERYMLVQMHPLSGRLKILLVIILAAMLPVFGEIVAINAGVWRYNWPVQIFGVPLLAIGLLVLLHSGIFVVMIIFYRSLDIPDPVYNNDERGLWRAE